MDLTAARITAAIQALGAAEPIRRVYGYSMSPRVHAALARSMRPSDYILTAGFGVPVIVDPRMTSAHATVYYNRRLFRRRLKDQARWEKRRKD